MRVLIVEDEEALAASLARGLRREGMAVDVALDGEDAIRKAALAPYDVVVLDRNLPRVHGDDVCRQLASSGPRILMLSASGRLEDRVNGFAIGADDYLPKPFAFVELVARVRAIGRRPATSIDVVLRAGDIELDPARRFALRGGRRLDLTPKEFAVLEALLRARGAVVSLEQLLEEVWDEHVDPFTNTARVTIMNLRRKLGDPSPIETVVGAGYRVAAE